MKNAEERFWEKVDVRGPDECWPWKGAITHRGYGKGFFRGIRQAHRICWTLARGPIPDGMHVLHKCDNRPCCNDGHLFIGTHEDNMADMYRKGRRTAATGEACGNVKLNRNEAMAVLFLRRHSSFTKAQIAKRFGISAQHVSMIDHGKSWSHLRRPPLYIEGLGT